MDTSVALVQAYLQVNGYFTVAEYPVLEVHRDHARAVTDLDILAFRFAGAGHDVIRGHRGQPLGDHAWVTDPVLGCPFDRPDMIVGEVKEGAARFNEAMGDPAVLEVALTRFGCCSREHARTVTRQLLSRGHASTPEGHVIRMVAFGDMLDSPPRATGTTVPMRHVVQFLQQYLQEHWDVVRHAQIRDPAFGVLALIEKWGVHAESELGAKRRPAAGTSRAERMPRRRSGHLRER